MKKLLIIAVFFVAFLVQINTHPVEADSTATVLGFDVDEDEWGSSVDYTTTSGYAYYQKNGVNYLIGYVRLKTAVYTYQTDDDLALVIAQTNSVPYNCQVPWLFGINVTYDSVVLNVNLRSDIDSTTYYVAYPYAYYSATGFELEQPSPSEEPGTTVYTLSVEVSEDPSASASVTFEDNELDLVYSHDPGIGEIFEVDYEYSCSGSDCSYMNSSTYNKGMFLVDMSSGYNGSVGDFINKMYMETMFTDDNNYFPTLVYKTINSLIYY